MAKYQLVVSNIGTVIDTNDFNMAYIEFKSYVEQSKTHYGRASQEDVTLFDDGEVYDEFIYPRSDEDELLPL